jgi:hypothetical protein
MEFEIKDENFPTLFEEKVRVQQHLRDNSSRPPRRMGF